MMRGIVEEGTPLLTLSIAGREWNAIVDTGFNGDLELPESVRPFVNAAFWTTGRSYLAADQVVEEDFYQVQLVFDGRLTRAIASFSSAEEILIGTHLLRGHHLDIDFPDKKVLLERKS